MLNTHSPEDYQLGNLSGELQKNILEIGGKGWILETLLDYPSLADSIPRQIVLKNTEVLQTEDKKRLGNGKCIVRQSHASDFIGLVDVLETQTCPIDRLEEIIEQVRTYRRVDQILKFAARERLPYSAEDTSILVSPYVFGKRITITEHPNLPGIVLVDSTVKHLCDPDLMRRNPYMCSPDMHNDSSQPKDFVPNYFDSCIDLMRKIRETGLFPDTMRLQAEAVFDQESKKTYLVQVRYFSREKRRDVVAKKSNARLFGVPDPEMLQGKKYQMKVEHHIRNVEDGDHEVLVVRNNFFCGGLPIESYPPEKTRIYLAGLDMYNPAMTHNNTRPIQAILKRSDGIADISTAVRNAAHGTLRSKWDKTVNLYYDEQNDTIAFGARNISQ